MVNPTVLDGPELLRTLLRRWWIVLGVALIAAAVGYVIAESQDEEYAAEQEIVIVGETPDPLVVRSFQEAITIERQVATQVDIMTSEGVRAAAEQRAGRDLDPLRAATRMDSNLVTVQCRDASRPAAVSCLNAYVAEYNTVLRDEGDRNLDAARAVLQERVDRYNEEFGDTRSREQDALSEARRTAQATLDRLDTNARLGIVQAQALGEPRALDDAVFPEPTRNVIIGAAIGALLGALIAANVRRRRRREPLPPDPTLDDEPTEDAVALKRVWR